MKQLHGLVGAALLACAFTLVGCAELDTDELSAAEAQEAWLAGEATADGDLDAWHDSEVEATAEVEGGQDRLVGEVAMDEAQVEQLFGSQSTYDPGNCGLVGQSCCLLRAASYWWNHICFGSRTSYCSVGGGHSSARGTCLACGGEGQPCCGIIANGHRYTGYACQSGFRCTTDWHGYPQGQGTCVRR